MYALHIYCRFYVILLFFECAALRGVCASSRNTASGLEGWWEGVSALSTSLEQCLLEDYPAGLHWIKYRSPMNPNLPDEVVRLENMATSHILYFMKCTCLVICY